MAAVTSTPVNHHHWHYLYRRRRQRRHHTSREILIGQLISLTGSVAAGFFLDVGKEKLALVAGAFLILPGIFDLGGSIGGALAAKVAHGLRHSKSAQVARHFTVHSLLFAFAVAAVAAVFLGFFGATLAAWFFGASFWTIFSVSVASCVLVALAGFPLITLATLLSHRLGLDPDNVIGPIETSIFDNLTILTLLIVLGVFA